MPLDDAFNLASFVFQFKKFKRQLDTFIRAGNANAAERGRKGA